MLYPILTESRLLVNLDGVWDFKTDNGNGIKEGWYAKKLENPMYMPVPSSYNDLSESAALRDHYGWVFYQRCFSLPEHARGQRVVLRFAAVTHSARVWLNGSEIGSHKGGFLPFEIEISDKLRDGDNLLTVGVDNRIDYSTLPVGNPPEKGGDFIMGGAFGGGNRKEPKNNPNFDFFNYCGITRPVKIYTTPTAYIKDITLTTEIKRKDAILRYQVDTEGAGEAQIEIFDETGEKVGSSDGKAGEILIKDVHLWQPMNAYLYRVRVTYGEDCYEVPYGIRSVEVKGQQFLINGKPFYFKGYGKHEDTFPAGRGLNMPMNVKDLSLLKWQHANSFRTSHYPYSEEMMRLCDREGIVVIDETPAVGIHLNFGGGAQFQGGEKVDTYDPKKGIQTGEHHREVIRDMIARDKNHACVVMWSIANEPDSCVPTAHDYFKPLFDLARELDPQKRPCTLVSMMNPNFREDCSLKLSDVICLNRYYGWYMAGGDLEQAEEVLKGELDFWQSTGKPVMFTEYGADTILGMRDTLPTLYSEEYQIAYYKMNHKVFDEHSCVVGEQVWNFADFATSQSLLRVQGNHKGIFTRDRKPKMAAYYLKSRWKKIPDFDYKS